MRPRREVVTPSTVIMDDLTTHQSGFMQASAANGFLTTSSADCSGTPFNFQPEYNTAKAGNINPWGADQVDISTEFETGHWEACTSLSDQIAANLFNPNDTSPMYNECNGPYENAGPPDANTPEVGDALCYLAGATHPGYDGVGTSTPPDRMTGCLDDLFQNGDLDFDGTPYWKEWPTSLTPNIYPASFLESFPTTNGQQYTAVLHPDRHRPERVVLRRQHAVDGASWYAEPGRAAPCRPRDRAGSTRTGALVLRTAAPARCCSATCPPGSGLTTFGKDAQYGTNQFNTFGYPQFIGPSHNNPCCSSARPGV